MPKIRTRLSGAGGLAVVKCYINVLVNTTTTTKSGALANKVLLGCQFKAAALMGALPFTK